MQDQQPMSYGRFVASYLLMIIIGVGLAPLVIHLGLDPYRWVAGYGGAVFVMAGLGRPRHFFEVIRSMSWFALIPSTAVMRVILLGLGSLFLLGAFLLE